MMDKTAIEVLDDLLNFMNNIDDIPEEEHAHMIKIWAIVYLNTIKERKIY